MLVPGANGAAFFADFSRRVGTIAPDGEITQVPILYQPDSMTAAPNGDLWITAHEGTASFVMVFRP